MITRNGWMILAVAFAAILGLAVQSQAGAIAFWEFNDGAVGTDAWNGQRLVDSSGTGRDAFFSTTSVFVDGSADYGATSALRFTTEGDQVAFRDGYDAWKNSDGSDAGGTAAGDDINFGADDSFTIETLIKTTQADTGHIVSKDATGGRWWFILRDNVIQGYIRDDAGLGVKAIGSATVNNDTWHHIAMVRDAVNNELRLYVDYQLDATEIDTTTGSLANNVDVRIARSPSNTGDFVGDIDFVRISDTALAPAGFIQPVGVPEPSTIALLLCGITSLIFIRRR